MNSKTSQYKFPLPGVSTSEASAFCEICGICVRQKIIEIVSGNMLYPLPLRVLPLRVGRMRDAVLTRMAARAKQVPSVKSAESA